MTLEQCYEAFNGDLAGTLARVPKRTLVIRLAKMFIKDESANQLKTAMEEKNCEDAFKAAHSIKGVALNMGLTDLAAHDCALTEILRSGTFTGTDELYAAVMKDYAAVISAFNNLDE